ncbi:hypothetical protein [Aquimarina sp. 433]
MTDQEIKNNIIEKALEYGAPSAYAALFDDMSDTFRNKFMNHISDRDFGLPIVKYGHPNGCWVLIGTKEIAWQNERLYFLPIDQIVRFSIPKKEKEKAAEIQPNRMMRKFEFEILTIHTLDGDSYDIWLHKGKEYYGFWHMMIRFFGWRRNDTSQSV